MTQPPVSDEPYAGGGQVECGRIAFDKDILIEGPLLGTSRDRRIGRPRSCCCAGIDFSETAAGVIDDGPAIREPWQRQRACISGLSVVGLIGKRPRIGAMALLKARVVARAFLRRGAALGWNARSRSVMPDNNAGQLSACPVHSHGGGRGAAFRDGRRRRRKHARGFTLLEVLIAFAILALALAALMQTFGSGMRGVEASERHVTAALMARSLLERVGHDIRLEPGEIRGANGAFAWTVSMHPVEPADRRTKDELTVIPHAVAVTVAWPGGSGVTLESYRLAPVLREAP